MKLGLEERDEDAVDESPLTRKRGMVAERRILANKIADRRRM